MIKISFCTVSMNRLEHLQETFIKNIICNMDYPSIEFNLLNYNSRDGIDEWAKRELSKYIDMNIVKYYKTTEPLYFDRSHSRNMIFKLATGDLICNLDADNFCGVGFARYISDKFAKSKNANKIFLVRNRDIINEEDRNAFGRIVFRKEHFYELRGFDEQMVGYGFEDTDFINRLKIIGCGAEFIEDAEFLEGISHSQNLRISEERYSKTIFKIYVAQLQPYLSEVLFLFNDGRFDHSTLINNEVIEGLAYQAQNLGKHIKRRSNNYPIELLDDKIYSGAWKVVEDALIFNFGNERDDMILRYMVDTDQYKVENSQVAYTEVTNDFLKEDLIYLFPQIQNRNYMNLNLKKDAKINEHGFGKGSVVCNFHHKRLTVV